VLWRWQVSAYVWTKAIAAGAFLVPFLASIMQSAEVTGSVQEFSLGLSLFFLMLTGMLLVIDLDQPKRFLYVLLRPQWKSWLVRGGYAIAIYGGLLTLWGVAKFFERQIVETVALWSSAIFAIIAAVYTAFLFAQAKGRDFWQSPTLALHMLAHAVMAGAAVFAILALFLPVGENWIIYLRAMLYGGIAFNLIVIAAELMTAHPTADAKATVRMIVFGVFSAHFWLGTIILGNVLPLLLMWLGGAPELALAGVAVLAGIYITEHIWVRAPQLIPLS
jgi:formate-dependent nitrite reductase membrane component NrfD